MQKLPMPIKIDEHAARGDESLAVQDTRGTARHTSTLGARGGKDMGSIYSARFPSPFRLHVQSWRYEQALQTTFRRACTSLLCLALRRDVQRACF